MSVIGLPAIRGTFCTKSFSIEIIVVVKPKKVICLSIVILIISRLSCKTWVNMVSLSIGSLSE